MKELSIEEKAKRYDEAIKRAKSKIKNDKDHVLYEDDVLEIFPELKVSEDEEVRKALYEYFKKLKDDGDIDETWYGFSYDKILAWLEKQGELVNSLSKGLDNAHKRIDGLTQKNNSLIEQLEKKQGKNNMGISETTKQELEDNLNKACKDEQKPTDKVEPKFHEDEWVVTDKNNIVQIKAVENGKYVLENTMRFTVDYVDKCWRKWTIQDAKACDILADDYGIYIFDEFDKDDERCFLCIGAYQYSQKVYEYERMLCSIDVRPATKEQRDLLFQKMHEASYEWDAKKKELKKIKQNPAWSEEDEKMLNSFLHKLEVCDLLSNKECIWIKNKLNSLKDRVQPKQEWSEEDKNRFTNLISLVKCSKENDATKVGFIEFINKLKSLSLKTTWKPSDEQLKMLDEIIDVLHRMQLFCGSNALIELKYDLKKLRGE